MKKNKLYTIGMLMMTTLLSTASCTSCTSNEETNSNSKPVIDPVEPITDYVLTNYDNFVKPLYNEISAKSNKDENFMVSPLSIAEVLTMISNGAKGETLKQTLAVMGLDTNVEKLNEAFSTTNKYLTKADPETSLAIANSLWIDKAFNIKDEYVSTNKKWLNAESRTQELPTMQTMNDINSWCKNNTNGCIPKLLKEPLDPSTYLVLINALYFKGIWEKKFDKENTREGYFTNIGGSVAKVDMMHQTDSFNVWIGKKMDMIELPYGNETFCMEVYLPHKGENLENCMRSLSQDTFFEIRDQKSKQKVHLGLPRMELKYDTSIKEPLMNMGMTDAFRQADLSGISDGAINISDVKHITYIKVDEDGTEAAAVTAAFVIGCAAPERLVNFVVDRPFAYIIREKSTGMILFMGRVVKM